MYQIEHSDILEKLALLRSSPSSRSRTHRPSMWKVIYLDDDFTSPDFLYGSLITHFGHSRNVALALMLERKENGECIAGTFSREVAEQKMIDVELEAREHRFPLTLDIEAV